MKMRIRRIHLFLNYWANPPSLTGGKLIGFFVKTVKTRFRLIIDNTEF